MARFHCTHADEHHQIRYMCVPRGLSRSGIFSVKVLITVEVWMGYTAEANAELGR
jgi:hypothetical protein